jgi:hypothetical protein
MTKRFQILPSNSACAATLWASRYRRAEVKLSERGNLVGRCQFDSIIKPELKAPGVGA